ncbi:MAG: carboxypeptidase-like regulatory domain-containing protein, partial [Bacteroidia bacterium]|nr:carboxypeptidase-like regulatory domain-containing protein [Bacteroidia bacterium]
MASSQNNTDTLSLTFENKTLKEIILEIESKTNYQFFFKDEWLGSNTISGNYVDQSIEFILSDIFKDTILNFFIQDQSRIILTENVLIRDKIPDTKPEAVDDAQPINISTPVVIEETIDTDETETEEPLKIGKEEVVEVQTKYTISGFVRDLGTNKPMANVAITVRGTGIGTSTDADGFYSLQLEAGSYVLVTNSLNAKDSRKRIVVYNDGEVNFNLEENIETLQEVLVEAEIDRNVKEVITSVTKIDI